MPEPPDSVCRIRPPIAVRSFVWTSRSQTRWRSRRLAEGPRPVPRARAFIASA